MCKYKEVFEIEPDVDVANGNVHVAACFAYRVTQDAEVPRIADAVMVRIVEAFSGQCVRCVPRRHKRCLPDSTDS